ncbi:MAG: hypothetical protein AAGA53_13405 [Pseudomonadota bacterium]
MMHVLKFLISALSMVLGVWAFLVLPFWFGTVAFLLIAVIGHAIATRLFKQFATQDEIEEDLKARNQSHWDMNQ